MANTPTPRSYNQILGTMLSTFLSKVRLKGLKVGGPLLSIFETAAQSDLRATQETFTLLSAVSLENAEGTALDRHARDEGTKRIGAAPSSGYVTIGDGRFQKVSTNIYSGTPAPIVGSSTLYISSKDGFPGSGSIYLGRGTLNYEGPLQYVSITGTNAPYAINLAVNNYTKKFHNQNETVILAQGGDRQISAGTQVKTPLGNSSAATIFSTLYPVTLIDGEVSIAKVSVVATQAGSIGRIVAGAINGFMTQPFSGATVTNPLPFSNGNDAETDRDLKDRIRNLRQTRQRGIDLALKTAVTGLVSSDENKQVLSANVITRLGLPTTIYIDDGTGYEESTVGVSIESFTDYATGGESDFSISAPCPITKAYVKSGFPAPYSIRPQSQLTVSVGGVPSVHVFTPDQFSNISNASAYDVVAAINANSNLLFNARTADAGTNIVLFAKADSSESVEIDACDANDVFAFPYGQVQTMRLYKNDILLSKDGSWAIVDGNPQYKWKQMDGSGNGESLVVDVDGTGPQTYYFKDVDFVKNKTGYVKLAASNSLASWVTVLNAKIPGIAASTNLSQIILKSNSGASSRASINITGGSLVTKSMFDNTLVPVVGSSNDYTLNRNTGQIHLMQQLAVGDRLSAGTVSTRAFLESSAILSAINLPDGKVWVFVDGAAKVVPTSIAGSSIVNITKAGNLATLSATAGTFSDAAPGDWIVLLDLAFAENNRGAWRIAQVGANGSSVVVESASITAQANIALTSAGINVFRSTSAVQEIEIPANTSYTAVSIAAKINEYLSGATASVSRTNRVRLTTNTFGPNGNIMVAAMTVGCAIPIETGRLATTNPSQLGVAESGSSDFGTPTFSVGRVVGSTDAYTLSLGGFKYALGSTIAAVRRLPYGSTQTAFGTNAGFKSTIANANGGALTLRDSALHEWAVDDRVYAASGLAIGPQDTLSVILDNDTTSKVFSPSLFRRCSTTGAYGSTITLRDMDNGSNPLAVAWGTDFDFSDFVVWMKARVQTHLADPDKTILWRYKRFGTDIGSASTIRYTYPVKADQQAKATVDPFQTKDLDISVSLPSGVAVSLSEMHPTTAVGAFCTGHTGNGRYTWYLFTGLQITRLSRAGDGTVTATFIYPDSEMEIANPLNLAVGSYVYVKTVNAAGTFGATSGYRQILSVSAGDGTYRFTYKDGINTVDTVGDGLTTNTAVFYNDIADSTWAGVAMNQIVAFDSISNFPAAITGRGMRVTGIDPTNHAYIQVTSDVGVNSSVIDWGSGPVSDVSTINVFPLGVATAASIALTINDDKLSPVTATASGTGTGILSLATWDEANDIAARFTFVDGIKHVKASHKPASVFQDYTFDFKETADANLASGLNDWANEEVRLTPSNSATVARFLSSSAMGGLFANSEIRVSSQNAKLQLATNTIGSTGSVSVQGGTGNSALAAVVGSASLTADSQTAYVLVNTTEAGGIYAGSYVEIDNTLTQNKQAYLSRASTNLIGIANVSNTATFSFDAPVQVHHACKTYKWQFEKQGKYIAIVWDGVSIGFESNDPNGADSASNTPNFAYNGNLPGAWTDTKSFVPGDFVKVTKSASDYQTFQIVAIDNAAKIIWIYNPRGVEEVVQADLDFYTYNSAMPGDTLIVGSDAWGSKNRGSYEIVSATDLTITVSSPTIVNVSGPITGTPLNQIVTGSGCTLTKQVRSICANPADPSKLVIKFEDKDNYGLISSNYGSVVKALDKLNFPLGVFAGEDGYQRSIGLIGEATKVIYGDPRDEDTYPGYAASGSNINICGPIVRKLSVSLAVRLRSGLTSTAIFDSVRSAVAGVINNSKIGQPIPISEIVNAASSINGVLAVSVISPAYSPTNDVISVQPYEKAMVLSLNDDIHVSVVGS